MFVGFLPGEDIEDSDIPVRCLVVLENTPSPTVPEFPDRCDKMVQLWNRADDYYVARGDACELYDYLHGMKDGSTLPHVEESGYFAMVIEGVACPAPVENPNSKGHFVFSTNYLWRIKNPP